MVFRSGIKYVAINYGNEGPFPFFEEPFAVLSGKPFLSNCRDAELYGYLSIKIGCWFSHLFGDVGYLLQRTIKTMFALIASSILVKLICAIYQSILSSVVFQGRA